jgi:hypothetical protein
MESYGSRTVSWFKMNLSFAARSWTRLIAHGILFIRGPTRCINIWRKVSDGQEWSERYQSMCPNVTHVEELRSIIWDPPETRNPWAFPSENGKTSAWTSLWVYLAPRVGITQYGSSWTAWLSQPTSYSYPPPTEPDSMPSSTYYTLSASMTSRRPSSLIEDIYLLLAFGSNYKSIWAPISSEAQLITPDGWTDGAS